MLFTRLLFCFNEIIITILKFGMFSMSDPSFRLEQQERERQERERQERERQERERQERERQAAAGQYHTKT